MNIAGNINYRDLSKIQLVSVKHLLYDSFTSNVYIKYKCVYLLSIAMVFERDKNLCI